MRKYGVGSVTKCVCTACTTRLVRPHDRTADDRHKNLGSSSIFSGALLIGDIGRGSRMFVSRRIMPREPARCGFSGRCIWCEALHDQGTFLHGQMKRKLRHKGGAYAANLA